MRIILDTNVVMSALLWRGPPYRLLETIRQNTQLQPYSSPALLEELADVLTRPAATKQLAAIGKSAREVLACALAARADLIVTGDSDLLTLPNYQNIPILTPAEALRRLAAQQ
jgi:uncharacterized protein